MTRRGEHRLERALNIRIHCSFETCLGNRIEPVGKKGIVVDEPADAEVDVAVSALTSMIEPLLMVFLGGVVGGFLVAMYLPIFSIAGNIK